MITFSLATLPEEITSVLMEAITGFVDGMGALITDAFGLLVYAPATGLTDVATWGLVFGGIALVLGVVNRFTRA